MFDCRQFCCMCVCDFTETRFFFTSHRRSHYSRYLWDCTRDLEILELFLSLVRVQRSCIYLPPPPSQTLITCVQADALTKRTTSSCHESGAHRSIHGLCVYFQAASTLPLCFEICLTCTLKIPLVRPQLDFPVGRYANGRCQGGSFFKYKKKTTPTRELT